MSHENNVDWSAIRREFPTTKKFCYLNLANKAILPKRVEMAMRSWIDDIYNRAGEGAFSMEEI